MVASTLIATGGLGLAWIFFGSGYRAPARQFVQAVPGLVALVRDKFRVDELYDAVIIRPIRALSRGLYLVVDRVLIDRLLVHGSVLVVDASGRLARLFQAGDPQRYIAAFAIGIAALIYIASRPAKPDELKVTVEGAAVDADASRGAAGQNLLYGFDFDGDGLFDRQGRNAKERFVYEGSGRYTIKVVIKDPRWGTVTSLQKRVTIR
jgi:hypothetical protein